MPTGPNKLPRKPLRERLLRPFVDFTQLEASSGVLLMVAAVVALIWANSAYATGYFTFWNTNVTVAVGSGAISKPAILWINDGLMAVFFFLVGLEIKREIIVGELSSAKKAALPIAAAAGGMLVPALIYFAFNAGSSSVRGWGIPMATDIAFALGVLALAGPRVPLSLKVFLAALAIVDDLGAVLVIALFYTSVIDWTMLGLAGATFAVLLGLNKGGLRAPMAYIVLGIILWVFFLKSGIHATIAGVLLALTIPTKVHLNPAEFVETSREIIDEFESCDCDLPGEVVVLTEQRQSAVYELEKNCDRIQMPLERIENSLHPYVVFAIVPLFALANAGVPLGSGASALGSPVSLGIILGLVIGKPLGITLFTWLALKLKIAELPGDVDLKQIAGVGVLAGIGFTMSLFIAELAFDDPAVLTVAKISILAASAIAGTLGFLLVRSVKPPRIPAEVPVDHPAEI